MTALLEFFVRRPLLVNVLMVMAFISGIMAMTSLRYNTFPEVDTGLISIVTNNPGASAEDIELSITVPLEQEFLHIDGVEKMVSNSTEGQSTIMVRGNASDSLERYDQLETEIYNAVDRARAKLPSDLQTNPLISRPEKNVNTPLAQVLVVGSVPEETLRNITRKVRLELRTLKGVAGVSLEGYREREVRILLDDVKLRRLGISHDRVMEAIQSRKVRESGGSMESAAAEQDILTIGKFEHPKDVENVIVYEGKPGDFVRIKDIARVHYDFSDPIVSTSIRNRNAITMLVKAGEEADRLSTGFRIKKYIKQKNGTLPADVELKLINDDTLTTIAFLDVLASNAVAGIILVILVLLMFFQFRLAIWVALGIPTAIMMVFTAMPMLNLSVNILSMAALILMLGMLVDDGIVTAESIFRHHEYGHPPVEAAVMGTQKVILPVFVSAVTTIVALAPAAFMGGVQGKAFAVVPVVAILVLVMSLIECKLILPAHIAHSLSKASVRTGSLTRPWFQVVEDAYESMMMKVIPHRYLYALIIIATFFIVGALAVGNLIFVSAPETNSDIVFVKAEGPVGTPFSTMEEKLAVLERELREVIPASDLAEIVVNTGHHDHDRTRVTEGQDEAWGLISIYLKPAKDRELNSLSLRDQLVELYAQRGGFKSLTVRVANASADMGFPLEVSVIGNTHDRFLVSDLLLEYVMGIDGVNEVWSDYVAGKPIVSLKIDHNELNRYGLTVGEVSSAVKVAFNGKVVDTFDTVDDTISYRLMLDGIDLRDPASLFSLAITNKEGDNILLRNLVDFEQRPGEGTVRHFLGDKSSTVFATIDRKKISMLEINRLVSKHIINEGFSERFPELSFNQGGELVSEREQAGEIGKVVAIALIGIFFILLVLFHSFLQPLMVLFLIPLGIIGVLAAFSIQGMVLSISAMMGIIGLMGVIVNDALVMLDRLNVEQNLHSQHGKTLLHDRQIVECASVRLRPVVITTVTTCAGLFPAAYELGGSNELITPMIMVMFWGVLIASIVTLFLLPCFFAMERDLIGKLNPGYARQSLDEVIMYN